MESFGLDDDLRGRSVFVETVIFARNAFDERRVVGYDVFAAVVLSYPLIVRISKAAAP